MAKEYADAFCATYEDPSGFLEFLRERNRCTQWRRAPAPELRYAVLEEGGEIDGPHGNTLFVRNCEQFKKSRNRSSRENPNERIGKDKDALC